MSVCNRCGNSFSCGINDSRCWCVDMPKLRPIPAQYHDCLCPNCLKAFIESDTEVKTKTAEELIEGEDFYLENGFTVFTAKYHLKRGHCCKSGCRHCPW